MYYVSIAFIFQLDPSRILYLVNDQNTAVLPDNGVFEAIKLEYGGHYKVYTNIFKKIVRL